MLDNEYASKFMKMVARRTMGPPISVHLTPDEIHMLKCRAERIQLTADTNKEKMNLEQKEEQTIRGFVIECALCQCLPGAVHNLREFNVNDPETFDHDVEWYGLRIEVKSMPLQYRHWNHHSYAEKSLSTLDKAIAAEKIALIVGGFVLSDDGEGNYVAVIDWVINPRYYKQYGKVEEALGVLYRRFGRDRRFRQPPFAIWSGDYEENGRRYTDEPGLCSRVDERADGVLGPARQEEQGLSEPALDRQAG